MHLPQCRLDFSHYFHLFAEHQDLKVQSRFGDLRVSALLVSRSLVPNGL